MAISTSDSDKKYRDQTGPGRRSGKQEIYNSKWGKILSLCCVHIYGSSFTTGKNHIPWYLPSEECQFYNRAKTFVWQQHSSLAADPLHQYQAGGWSMQNCSNSTWFFFSVFILGQTDCERRSPQTVLQGPVGAGVESPAVRQCGLCGQDGRQRRPWSLNALR